MDTGGDDQNVKLVVLGDTGVGKSSLVLRFVNNIFKPYSESTIGAAFMSKTLTVDGEPVKYQIWDTAGQEKYHSLAPMYYRGAAAAVVVYSITDAASFNTLKSWVDELHMHGPPDIIIAVAGNKCDMEEKRKVPTADAAAYAKSINALFLETSAKQDTNVQDLFLQISKRLPAPGAGGAFEDDDPVVNLRKAPSKKGGCCS
mmetsp:Transcript_35362/g.72210  ORF Transcript_35362/g.72210 Transcript_35362/m.72210 type:complete len:201 (-) Transcript_35362:98-700(-)